MYAVVGCSECGSMWLLTDPRQSKTANCPRCGRTHQTKKLRKFLETEDREAARQARAALLAKKHGDSEAFAKTAHISEMESLVEESGIDDAEYLEASGLDADEVASAGEQAMQGQTSSSNRLDVVREALRKEDRPTEEEVVAYAEEHGVPGEAARNVLEKLTRRGEVSESRGRYRLL
ncbi:replication protein H [Halogeometricum borinquense]|nr:DUF5817 domain-containing protein [Halogeometricum borinquense]ADQ66589.1 hypothetical protein Hbor_09950 [Halogeometricum borinquense DSM 11551]QIB75092.1 replication protein H [Halogeometricum borinquense]QIQ75927.1 replication protein H [Halogeometricum borinquense]RYJ14445.1 replication protein H [Halogeometricum borinquense]